MWCNNCHTIRRIQVQILDIAACISFYADAQRKRMTPSLLHNPVINKYSRLGSLSLVQQSVYKENSGFRPAVLRRKIDLVLHTAHGGGVG